MNFANKKCFTLIEVVLASIILGIGLVAILVAISKGIGHIDRTRKEIIAINLAREGMEAVFNIRDSNWRRWSGRLEDCWLKENPLQTGASTDCGDDNRMQNDTNYVLSGKTINDSNFEVFYYFLSGVNIPELNLYDGVDNNDFIYKLCLDNDSGWAACPGIRTSTAEGSFFRIIEGKKLIDKHNSRIVDCNDGNALDGNANDCGADAGSIGISKEYIFCSRVEYMGAGLGKIEFCSSITNFLDRN